MGHSRLTRRWAAVLLAVAGLLWLLFNGRYEGPVLLTVDRSHGLTVADLASLAAFIAAGWLWISPSKS